MLQKCTIYILSAILLFGCCPTQFELATRSPPCPKKTESEDADWCGYVRVAIETEQDVFVNCLRLIKLRFCMDTVKNCNPTIFIPTDRVRAGAGLVIEHIGPDGARTRQAL